MTNELVHLARSHNLDDLETAWSQAVGAPSADFIPQYADTLDLLCEQDMASRALGMATSMIEALVGKGDKHAAMELGLRAMQRSAHNDALVKSVIDLIDENYVDEAWLPMLKERSSLANATVSAVLEFDELRRYTKGHVIYHPAGWGEGTVEEFDGSTQETTVLFATGRRSEFPFDTLLDSFKTLNHDDLRAMKLQRMDQLQHEAQTEPNALIRRAAILYRGTISSTQLKKELAESIIELKKWPTWWKKAKTAATKDPWLKVEGSPTRPIFIMRKKPVSLVDEASTTLKHQNNLGERVAVLRDYLKRSEDTEVRDQIIDLALLTVEKALEEKQANPDSEVSHAHILDGILFLEEQKRKASVSAAEELRALLMEDGETLNPSAINQLMTQASREHAVQQLPQALGGDWAAQCIASLTEWPATVGEHVADKLVATKHGPEILTIWHKVAPYPRRHPLMTYLLGKYYSDGIFDDQEGCPDAVSIVRVLLQLARILNEDRKKNQLHSRLLNRVFSLLTGKRGLLDRACNGISREDLEHYIGIVARAGEDFPPELEAYLDRTAGRLYPDLLAQPERPFWDKEFIYTTQAGLRRVEEEYRVLVDVKIPENSKAIGAAASLGDLSENSEWDAAMEEQRNLTGRAQEMDEQIRSAKLIEDQEIPDNVVAPGQEITLIEDDDEAKKHVYRVLGPWDMINDETINYMAPMAQGLLGLNVGDTGEMPSLTGPIKVRVEAINRIDLQ